MSTNTPQRLLKEKLRQKRAELILEVAEEVLMEKGYHDASMDEIAARTGVAKGTLYQHFPAKEDLVFALIDRQLVLFEQTVAQIAASQVSARNKLERILHYIYLEQHGSHTQLLHLLHDNADLRKGLFEKKEQLRNHLQQTTDLIKAMLEEGKAEGIFDRKMATEVMFLTFMQLLSLRRQEQLFTREQTSAEDLFTHVGRIFFEGISSASTRKPEQ